jgi:hypothetical protein
LDRNATRDEYTMNQSPVPTRSQITLGYGGAAAAIALALALTWWVCAPGPFLHSIVFGAADNYMYYGPATYFLDHALHNGELPLWNPLVLCGQPFAANPSSGVFYPFMLLRSVLAGGPTPINSFVSLFAMSTLHIVVAGFGAYALAREYRLSAFACITAALVYALSAPMIKWWPESWVYVAGATWFPYALLFVRRVLCAETFFACVNNAAILTIVLALVLLTGAAQLALHIALALVLFTIFTQFELARRSDGATVASKRIRTSYPWPALVLAAILSCALAAPMLLPAAELARHTPRAKAVGEPTSMQNLTYAPLDAIEHTLVYVGGPGLHFIRGAGSVAALLAVAALVFSRRHRAVLLWSVLFLALFDCSMGPPWPIASGIARIAFFVTDAPPRVMVLTCLPIAMLAGFGVDAVAAIPIGGKSNTVRIASFAVTSVLFAGIVAYRAAYPNFAPVSDFAPLPVMASAFLIFMLFWQRAPGVLVCALPVLFLMETLISNHEFLPHILSRVHIQDKDRHLRDVRKPAAMSLENLRTFDNLPNTGVLRLQPAINGFEDLYLHATSQMMSAGRPQNEYLRLTNENDVDSNVAAILKQRVWLLPTNSIPTGGGAEMHALLMASTPAEDHVKIVRSMANELQLQIADLDSPHILIYTDTTYPGWTATVDGNIVSVESTIQPFKTIAITEGDHDVRFLFRPHLVYTGYTISLLSAVVLLALVGASKWQSVRRPV